MSLETGAFIVDLVETNPVGATDFVSQGDDHIRLLKVCIKGSFPNLGTGAVTCTVADLNKLTGLLPSQAELNFVDGVTSAIQTQIDTKASSAALSSAISGLSATYQPLDADLTAIAALTTTTYGRGFLSLADLAATATKLAALVPVWTAEHAFTGTISSQVAATGTYIGELASGAYPAIRFVAHAAPTNAKVWEVFGRSDDGSFTIRARDDAFGTPKDLLVATRTGAAITAIDIGNATDTAPVSVYDATVKREVGFRDLPTPGAQAGSYTLQASDRGKIVPYTGSGGHTFTGYAGAEGATITVYNAGSAALTLAPGSGTLFWLNGAGSIPTGNRTLAIGGIATFWRVGGGGSWAVWGNGLS